MSILVLKNARLIDGLGSAPREKTSIIVEGGRIKSIGTAADSDVSSDAINLHGLTAIPGLIDCHVHFGGYTINKPGKINFALAFFSFFVDYYRSYDYRRKLAIQSGITTIRSAGDIFPQIIELRDRINSGRLIGPRICASGAMFTCPGGHPVSTIYNRNRYIAENATRQVTNSSMAREEVAKLAEVGVDCVKIIYSKRNPLNIREELPRLDANIVKEIIDEAHRHALPAMVHTGSVEETEEAVDLGADSIEHGILPGGNPDFSDAVTKKLVSNGTFFVPTLAPAWAYRSIYPEFVTDLSTLVRKLHDGGVRIAAGTDSGMPGVVIGQGIHRELELLVHAGLSPMEAIVAASKDAALNLGKLKDLGTIEPGKMADIVCVSGDPLADIKCTSRIQLVIKDGIVLFNKTRSGVTGHIESH